MPEICNSKITDLDGYANVLRTGKRHRDLRETARDLEIDGDDGARADSDYTARERKAQLRDLIERSTPGGVATLTEMIFCSTP